MSETQFNLGRYVILATQVNFYKGLTAEKTKPNFQTCIYIKNDFYNENHFCFKSTKEYVPVESLNVSTDARIISFETPEQAKQFIDNELLLLDGLCNIAQRLSMHNQKASFQIAFRVAQVQANYLKELSH